MTSYQALINHIEAFYNNHLQVKKVGSDFTEQLPNFATKDERYPLVFIAPVFASPTTNTNTISLEIYCFDIIQKDRANITVILSDCHQILVDLVNQFTFSDDYSFDIIGLPSLTPMNNQLLDYAAGWMMSLDVDMSNWTDCQVPLLTNLPVVVGCDTILVTYTLIGEEPVTVEVETNGIVNGKNNYFFLTPEGGIDSNIRWNNITNQWDFNRFPGGSLEVQATLSEDTECPFGTYTIEEGSIFEAFEVNPIL
jgi:hypothetical protein